MEENFFFGAGFVIGLILGSFATVLSYRVPRGLSIVMPRSRCVVCEHSLTPRDLVPVFSWIAQRGRCRHCGAKISARYPMIELATAFLCAIAFRLFGPGVPLLLALIVIVGLVAFVAAKLQKT